MRNLPPDRPAHCYKGVWDQVSTRGGPERLLLLILEGAHIVVPRPGSEENSGASTPAPRRRRQNAAGGTPALLLAWHVGGFLQRCGEVRALCGGSTKQAAALVPALAPTMASMQAVGLDLFHAWGRDYLVSWWTGTPGTRSCSAFLPPRPLP